MPAVCPCGNVLRVGERHVGRTVLCPACGKPLVVPPQIDQPGPSAPKPHAAAPVRRPSAWGGVLATLVALALVAVGAWWWWTREPSGPFADLLDYVTPDAEVVGRVRLAEMWAKMPARRAGDSDPGAGLERDTGLRPEEIERAWVVWHRPAEDVGWVVIRTRKAYTRNKVLSRLDNVESEEAGGQRMHSGNPVGHAGRAAVAFLDARTLLVGSVTGVRLALEREKGEKVDDWAGDAQVEVRLRPPAWLEGLDGPLVPRGLIALRGLKAGAFTIGMGEEAKFKGSFTLEGAAEAAEARDGMQVGLQGLRLSLLVFQIQGGDVGAAAVTLDRLLGDARVTAAENVLTFETSGGTEETLRALAALPGMFKR